MWSERTIKLRELLAKSEEQDFYTWLPKLIEEDFQKYLNRTIRYVMLSTDSEYNDEGGTYSYVSHIGLFDVDKKSIDLEDIEDFKPEYLTDDGEDFNDDDAKWLYDSIRDYFYGSAKIIDDLGIGEEYIDLEEAKRKYATGH